MKRSEISKLFFSEKLFEMMGDIFLQILQNDSGIRSRMRGNFLAAIERGIFD